MFRLVFGQSYGNHRAIYSYSGERYNYLNTLTYAIPDFNGLISAKEVNDISNISDDDIFYLYLINLINKNKKNVSN